MNMKKRPEYDNTIFIITGDHRLTSLFKKKEQIMQISVPLIIFSPMLKTENSNLFLRIGM
jgi:phosphoglycerol transferase MdoB-like AlkP superfamily enzyme